MNVRLPARILATTLALLLALPALAYDRDTHYAWTYYLALQVGFTDRQAFQIASGTQAIDDSAPTDPMGEATLGSVLWGGDRPGDEDQRVGQNWRGQHCFAEDAYQLSGQEAPSRQAVPGLPDKMLVMYLQRQSLVHPDDLKGPVKEDRDRRRGELRTLARTEGNPGALLHFAQDCYAHYPFNDIRGHSLFGHFPDWMAASQPLAWAMTLDTLEELKWFYRTWLGGSPRSPDMGRIRQVFDEMIAANPPSKLGLDPMSPPDRYLDAAYDDTFGWFLNFISPVVGTGANQAGRPDLAKIMDVNNPSLPAARLVIANAIDQDRLAGRLPQPIPDYPEDLAWRGIPPREWIRYPFAIDASMSHASDWPFAVEKPEIEALPAPSDVPSLAVAPDRSSKALYRIEVAAAYEISGLAGLILTHPVHTECGWSDYPDVSSPPTEHRDNGEHVLKSYAFRTQEQIEADLSWSCTVFPYGQEAFEITVDVDWSDFEREPPSPTADLELVKRLETMRGHQATALGLWAHVDSTCTAAESSRSTVEELARDAARAGSRIDRDLDGIERLAGTLEGAAERAERMRLEAWAAAESSAQARDGLGAATSEVCSLTERILATWEVPELEKLRARAEQVFDRAGAERDRARTGIRTAADRAEQIEDLSSAAREVDGALASAAPDPALDPGALLTAREALSGWRSVLEPARRLVSSIEPQRAAAASILEQSEEDLGTRFAPSPDNKEVLRDMRAVYRDIASRTDVGACLDRESEALDALEATLTEVLAAAASREERITSLQAVRPTAVTLEVLRVAALDARATAGAADLFSESVESRFDDAQACWRESKRTERQRTSKKSQVARHSCPQPGAVAAWNPSAQAPGCECPYDRMWNTDGSACVMDPAKDPNNPYRDGCKTAGALAGVLAALGDAQSQASAAALAESGAQSGCAEDLYPGAPSGSAPRWGSSPAPAPTPSPTITCPPGYFEMAGSCWEGAVDPTNNDGNWSGAPPPAPAPVPAPAPASSGSASSGSSPPETCVWNESSETCVCTSSTGGTRYGDRTADCLMPIRFDQPTYECTWDVPLGSNDWGCYCPGSSTRQPESRCGPHP